MSYPFSTQSKKRKQLISCIQFYNSKTKYHDMLMYVKWTDSSRPLLKNGNENKTFEEQNIGHEYLSKVPGL